MPESGGTSLGDRVWRALKREPVLFVTYGYVAVSFLGLWGSWWFYRALGLDILKYMQGSDLLVSGVREPTYMLLLVFGVAYAALTTTLLRRREERARADASARPRWWESLLVPGPRSRSMSRLGLSPATSTGLGLAVMMLFGTAYDARLRARRVLEDRPGRIDYVQVRLAGIATAEPGAARLLGTSAAFVFLYWPRDKRAEVIPISAVVRIRTVPAPGRMAAPSRRER